MAKYKVDVYMNEACSDERDEYSSSWVDWIDTDSKEKADAFIQKNLAKGYYCEMDNGLFLKRYYPDRAKCDGAFYDDLHMEQLEQM